MVYHAPTDCGLMKCYLVIFAALKQQLYWVPAIGSIQCMKLCIMEAGAALGCVWIVLAYVTFTSVVMGSGLQGGLWGSNNFILNCGNLFFQSSQL